MGKFYIENKDRWEKHRRERAYKEQLESGGGLFSNVPVDETVVVRFATESGALPPSVVQLVDFGQPRVAVVGGNALIGALDDASSTFMREYFRKYPALENVMPATVVGQDNEWSDLWVAQLGVGKKH